VMRLMGTDLPKPAKEQLMDSRRRPHVVVATMGRLKSFLERGTLRADRLKMLVIDEVDEMIW
jgi:ATP-dependent RNA helicase DeaD